jgi:hypothetical protein
MVTTKRFYMQLNQSGKLFHHSQLTPSGDNNPLMNNDGGKQILCIGDSWFSIGGLPSDNILGPLKFAQSTLLYSTAIPGNELKNMCEPRQFGVLQNLLFKNNFAWDWNAIFISGGGNDFLAHANAILIEPKPGGGLHTTDYIDQIELSKLKVAIHTYHKKLASLRDGPYNDNKNTPIITHIYDYPTARPAPATVAGLPVTGPWLMKAFKDNKIPEAMWITLTEHLFKWLGATLVELTGIIDNFHVISNTRGVLRRADVGSTGVSGDWLNEIHPTGTGYAKLAAVISPQLQALLK